MKNHLGATKLTDHLFISLLLIYIFLFEWTLFLFAFLDPIVNLLKIYIPVFLFLLTVFARIPLFRFRPLQNYLFLLSLFFIWALIPSFLSNYSSECINQWLKYLPKCLMVFSLGIYFMERPQAQVLLMKYLSVIGFFVVMQFFLLNIAFYDNPNLKPSGFSGNGAPLYGPFSLFGSQLNVTGVSMFRLVGYWVEPSKASGFLFPIFFLAQAVYFFTEKNRWKTISYICLIGGFLCLSNAGYLAISGAILFGILRVLQLPKIKLLHFISLIIAVFFILFSILGRLYISTHNVDSPYLRAVTGAYVYRTDTNYDEISNGRVEILQSNLNSLLAHPLGIGLRIPGTNKEGMGFTVSASAPAFWLIFTGLPGLILLLFIQFQIVYTNFRYAISTTQLRVTQAWVAALLQQSVYGDWMSPFFLVLSAFVLISIYHYQLLEVEHIQNGEIASIKNVN